LFCLSSRWRTFWPPFAGSECVNLFCCRRDIAGNGFNSSVDVLATLENLQVLNLRNEPMSSLDDIFYNMTSLTTLYVCLTASSTFFFPLMTWLLKVDVFVFFF
jgi:hypothetical protein